jgi:hypothetical protein
MKDGRLNPVKKFADFRRGVKTIAKIRSHYELRTSGTVFFRV